MISEFRVRKELDAIEHAAEKPLTRVRRYLRLARSSEAGCIRLLRLSWWHFDKNEGGSASRFYNAAKRLFDLSREARSRAGLTLQRCGKFGFGYAPRGRAHYRARLTSHGNSQDGLMEQLKDRWLTGDSRRPATERDRDKSMNGGR